MTAPADLPHKEHLGVFPVLLPTGGIFGNLLRINKPLESTRRGCWLKSGFVMDGNVKP